MLFLQHRRTELGSEAIMGPRSSPQKRLDTMAPQGASKRRRKPLKYPIIGEDWGEQEPPSLADEQSVSLTPPHTGSPNNAGEQGKKGGTMVQHLISGYFTPDRVPLRSGMGGIGPASLGLTSGGSPCNDGMGFDILEIVEQTTIEMGDGDSGLEGGVNNQIVLVTSEVMEEVTGDDCVPEGKNGENNCVSTLTPSEDDCEEDRKCMRGEGALVTDDMDDDCTWGMTKKEEVTENICEPVDVMRRQECEVTLPPSVNECVVDDLEAPTENECVWGVRGWCKTHKIYGKKYTTTSKDWEKKKDGTFGWVYKRKTNYTCTGVRGMGDLVLLHW